MNLQHPEYVIHLTNLNKNDTYIAKKLDDSILNFDLFNEDYSSRALNFRNMYDLRKLVQLYNIEYLKLT